MLTTILFCIALTVLLWAASIITAKLIVGESIVWWLFASFSISGMAVITHIMNIW